MMDQAAEAVCRPDGAKNERADRAGEVAVDPEDSFFELEGRLRVGDSGAAEEVFRRFGGRLIGLARARLDVRIRGKEDPEDVVQSVYRSFFARHRTGQYDLRDWDSLWSLLTVITVRKCLNRADYYLAQCRNVAVEVAPGSRGGAAALLGEALDREPTPFEAAILAETLEHGMRGFERDDRAIIELKLQGYSAPEIGERLGRAERTVRRVCEYFRLRLSRMQVDGIPAA